MDTITALVVALIIANLAVSIALLRSAYYQPAQKLAQICIVWLLPALGALLIGAFLYSQRDRTMFNTRAYPERSEKMLGVSIHDAVQGRDPSD